MSVYAKQYPSKLQGVVKHAERFAVLLAAAWTDREEGKVWLLGRQDEVELVVRTLVEDWEAGRVDEDGAASAVGAYLRAMHFGARRVLEAGDTFACCDDGGAITLPPVDRDAVTRLVSLPVLSSLGLREAPLASDTVAVDPEVLLAEWAARTGPK
jgi:hypothetical protein